jgi:hypothetical protein
MTLVRAGGGLLTLEMRLRATNGSQPLLFLDLRNSELRPELDILEESHTHSKKRTLVWLTACS